MDCNGSSVAVAVWATRALPAGKRLQEDTPKFVARSSIPVFHPPDETFFDLADVRHVTGCHGAGRYEF